MQKTIIAALVLLAGPALAQTMTGAPGPIAPQQALHEVGQNVTVTGRAFVHKAQSRLGTYIDLNGHGRSAPFAGYIPPGNETVFPQLRALNGKDVAISGVVQLRKGVPIIIMTQPGQLEPAG